jgi:hypothetical protein
MSNSCPPFWLNNPMILFSQASEFFPFTEHDIRCTASALNSFTRFGIYLGFLLALVRMDASWLLTGIVFAIFTLIAWKVMESRGSVREGFTSEAGYRMYDTDAPIVDPQAVSERYAPDIIGSSGRTAPSAANPFMNVLISEISDNPYRKPAANVEGTSVKAELDSYFETMFYSDPGDTFNRTQSQRQWVTMPSTTIPNDQESFQNWLYRVPGQTCKEGNLGVCYFNTGDEAYPWRETRRLT